MGKKLNPEEDIRIAPMYSMRYDVYTLLLRLVMKREQTEWVRGLNPHIPDSTEKTEEEAANAAFESGEIRENEGRILIKSGTDKILRNICRSKRVFVLDRPYFIEESLYISVYFSRGVYLICVQNGRQNRVDIYAEERVEAVYRLIAPYVEKESLGAAFSVKAVQASGKTDGLDMRFLCGVKSQISAVVADSRSGEAVLDHSYLLDRKNMFRISLKGGKSSKELLKIQELRKDIEGLLRLLEDGTGAQMSEGEPDDSGGTPETAPRPQGGFLNYGDIVSREKFPRSGAGFAGWYLKQMGGSLIRSFRNYKKWLIRILAALLSLCAVTVWNIYAACYINDTFMFDRRAVWGNLTPYLIGGTVQTPNHLKGFGLGVGTMNTVWLVMPLYLIGALILFTLISRVRSGGVKNTLLDLAKIPSRMKSCIREEKENGSGRAVVRRFMVCLIIASVSGFLLMNPITPILLGILFLLFFAQGENNPWAVLIMLGRCASSYRKVEEGEKKPPLFSDILLNGLFLGISWLLYSGLNLLAWSLLDYGFWPRIALTLAAILFAALCLAGKKPGKAAKAAGCFLLVFAVCWAFREAAVVFADDGGISESGNTLAGLLMNAGFSTIFGASLALAAGGLLAFLGIACPPLALGLGLAGGLGMFGLSLTKTKAGDYISKTAKKFMMGNYDEDGEDTLLGTAVGLLAGVTPIGPVLSILESARDVTYDITHLESSWQDIPFDALGFLDIKDLKSLHLNGSRAGDLVEGAYKGLQDGAANVDDFISGITDSIKDKGANWIDGAADAIDDRLGKEIVGDFLEKAGEKLGPEGISNATNKVLDKMIDGLQKGGVDIKNLNSTQMNKVKDFIEEQMGDFLDDQAADKLQDGADWMAENIPKGIDSLKDALGKAGEGAPDVPDVPDVPNIPDVPDVPDVPNIPDVPDVPNMPDVPNIPNIPDVPDMPDVPDAPTETGGAVAPAETCGAVAVAPAETGGTVAPAETCGAVAVAPAETGGTPA